MGRSASFRLTPVLGILLLAAVAATLLAAVTALKQTDCGPGCQPARFGSSAFGAAGRPGSGASGADGGAGGSIGGLAGGAGGSGGSGTPGANGGSSSCIGACNGAPGGSSVGGAGGPGTPGTSVVGLPGAPGAPGADGAPGAEGTPGVVGQGTSEVFQAPQAAGPQEETQTIIPNLAQQLSPAQPLSGAPPNVVPVIVVPIEPPAPETPRAPEPSCAGLGSLLVLLGLGELLGLC